MATSAWTQACGHRPRAAVLGGVTSPDSLAGIVSVTGTSFEQQLVLLTGARAVPLRTASTDSASLVRLGGAEIVAYGRAANDRFRVNSFVVRSVSGATVADGTLERVNGRLVLRTSAGPLPLGNPPEALDSLVGARVWIAGPLATGPNTYGMIAPVP